VTGTNKDKFCPYKGPDSYTFADRPLFFGRSNERRLVAALIASERLSVFTGPSGCGKSSLLKAGVVPDLLAGGWAVAYAHPGRDPEREIVAELELQTRPQRAAEQSVLDLLQKKIRLELGLGPAGNGEAQTPVPEGRETRAAAPGTSTALVPVAEARAWFARLQPGDPSRRSLLGIDDDRIQRIPFLAQALAGLIDPKALVRRLSGEPPQSEREPDLDSVGKFLSALPARPPAATAGSNDIGRAVAAFMKVGRRKRGFRGLVIILDQAEELFTRFGDPVIAETSSSANRLPVTDWKIREQFFDSLRRLLQSTADQPLRVCISLRPEWFAALTVALQSVAPAEEAVFHLTLFERDRAVDALRNPAREFEVSYTDECEAKLLNGLMGEDRRIDPFLLALTTERVWHDAVSAAGRQRIEWSDAVSALRLPDPLEDPRATVAQAAVSRALDLALENHTTTERFDILEMIGNLSTPQGSRMTVPKGLLVDRPMRRREQLEAALAWLDGARLVRLDKREGAPTSEISVEIKHDRLLVPARERLTLLRQEDQRGALDAHRNRAQLPAALTLLAALPVSPLDLVDRTGDLWDRLPVFVRDCVCDNFDLLQLDQPASLLMIAGLLNERLSDARDDSRRPITPDEIARRDKWVKAMRAMIDSARAPPRAGDRRVLAEANKAVGHDGLLAMVETALTNAAPAGGAEAASWIERWQRTRA
jgi:hypothetical protein